MFKPIRGMLLVLSVCLCRPVAVRGEEQEGAFFPWLKEMAGDQALPLPTGLRAIFYYQGQDMDAETIGLTVPSRPGSLLPPLPPGLPAEVADLESDAYNISGRLDLWLLPFLNLYGVIGYVDGKIRAEGLTLPAPVSPAITALIPAAFTLEYDGPLYGGGATLAAGAGALWASLDANFTRADLNLSDSSISMLTVSPRAGVKGTLGGAEGKLWVGAMYQDVEEEVAGSVNFPLTDGTIIPARYEVRSKAEEPWNLLAGARWDIHPRWNVSVEAGFLERVQVMTSLEYRF